VTPSRRFRRKAGAYLAVLDVWARKAFARAMNASSPLVVHHLESSRSLRVLWLLEELGLPYELKRYARDENFRAPPALKTVHPLGRSPVVEVDGHVLAESGAIIEYLVERAGGTLRPQEHEALLRYRFFLHYAEGSAMPPLLVQLLVEKIRAQKVPFFVRPITRKISDELEKSFSQPAIATHFGFVDDELAKRPYFAGEELSAADIQMIYPVEAALLRGKGDWPNLRAWRQRVTTRPAYQRAESRGGPAMPAERQSGTGHGSSR
jgi:glutathione S-transferase